MSTVPVSEACQQPAARRSVQDVCLAFHAAERLRAAVGVLVMWAVALGWTAFMLNVALWRSQTPATGRPVALALILVGIPFLWWGSGYWRQLIARPPRLWLRGDRLVIDHAIALRSPLVLHRSQLAGVAIDDIGMTDGRDVLRFPIVTDVHDPTSRSGRWLYSRYAGAPIPSLAEREQSPNVALLFKRPLLIDAARLPHHRPLQVNGGAHALYREQAATGILLRVDDVDATHALLSPWGVERPVAEGDLTAGQQPETYPSLATATTDHT